MKYLRVKDLIEKLKEYDGELPVVVEDEGKGHHYGIIEENINITTYAYFGNDPDCERYFNLYDEDPDDLPEDKKQKFLNLGWF